MQAEEAHKERVRSRVAKGQTLPDEPPQGAARACSLHHRFRGIGIATEACCPDSDAAVTLGDPCVDRA